MTFFFKSVPRDYLYFIVYSRGTLFLWWFQFCFTYLFCSTNSPPNATTVRKFCKTYTINHEFKQNLSLYIQTYGKINTFGSFSIVCFVNKCYEKYFLKLASFLERFRGSMSTDSASICILSQITINQFFKQFILSYELRIPLKTSLQSS